jgi:hypothetical protein
VLHFNRFDPLIICQNIAGCNPFSRAIFTRHPFSREPESTRVFHARRPTSKIHATMAVCSWELLPLTVFHFTRIGRVVVYQPHCLHHRHSGKFRNDEVANFARSEKHFDVCTQVSGNSSSRLTKRFPSSNQDMTIERKLIVLSNIT